ncbi:MAG: DsbA family protein [Rhodospirillales bacterium]
MRTFFWCLVGFVLFSALPAAAAVPTTEQALAERSLGSADAPVTIIEYSSLTCPHCAEFHHEVFGKIKSTYIDTGKVRYILRDFPLEPRAMAAAIVARCVAPDRYFGFIAMLFDDQQTWARSKDLLTELQVRAQVAGLSSEDFNACLNNAALMQGIQKRAEEGQAQYGIDSTPSFVVNGKKMTGGHSFADFEAAIAQAMPKTP